MATSERRPRRSTVTVLASACGLAVASLAAGAQAHDTATVPLAPPDSVAHPPVAQLYPLPTDRSLATADTNLSAIGPRLSQLTPIIGNASPGFMLDDGTIPGHVLAAYQRAADILSRRDPSCNLHWSVLAGIGRIESGHASGGALLADGQTASPILGPRLDGSLAGTATIPDSTGGQFDGDPVWERAVGPMQFLPSTWLVYGQDGNGDGVRDPHNVYDAALGSAVYLCAGFRDLSKPADLNQALFSYNPSLEYVQAVLAWADHYAGLGPRPGAGRIVTLAASLDTAAGTIGKASTQSKDKADSGSAEESMAPQPPTTPQIPAAPQAPAQPPPATATPTPDPTTTPAPTPSIPAPSAPSPAPAAPKAPSGEQAPAPTTGDNGDKDGHDRTGSDGKAPTTGTDENTTNTPPPGGSDAPSSPSDGTTEGQDPAEGEQPAEPAQPTEPSEPAEPAEPTEPTEPAEPTEPSEPARPGEPTKPHESTEPRQPSQPDDSCEQPDAEDGTGQNESGDTEDTPGRADDVPGKPEDETTCEQPGDGNGGTGDSDTDSS